MPNVEQGISNSEVAVLFYFDIWSSSFDTRYSSFPPWLDTPYLPTQRAVSPFVFRMYFSHRRSFSRAVLLLRFGAPTFLIRGD